MLTKKLHALNAGDTYARATGRPLPISTDYAAKTGFYTGNEHGLVWAEYLSDDEYLADVDPELDAYAHREWAEDNEFDLVF
ncbi:hypothetical protein [Mesorhizobium sp.]|uniref:hypothetical protein n=1 Tax=Mesorhizobium sp. TaxID=1871066 RepID=UPI000FEA7689|nr:hypothetical protein [Mesorhizobium sp.]RWI35388.1 MAG: hypothetical protein EOR14_28200 [Mesorhizobium sp.]RWJ66443.1 MAG: hypothetical protein EOR34_28935 [Mesorhizobium sp.]